MGNIISYDPPTTERGSLNTGESGVEMLVMEADIDNVKTDTGKTYCIGMGSYSVFKKSFRLRRSDRFINS